MRHWGTALIAVTAIAFGSAGIAQFALLVGDRPAVNLVPSASLDGLTAAVNEAGWLNMDMPQTGGYQMPAGMMPGMPAAGDGRLALTVTVVNTTSDTRPLRATDEFSVRTAHDGKRWTAVSASFGDLPRLAPGNGVTGMLYFDLPATDFAGPGTAWVEWHHLGATSALEIPLVGAAPAHSHTS
jgi:hypothetical protein